ncbi:TonB-dependent receptor [Acetobacter senegalensis DSM 18889]|nr:TonB-dependent receptor [Acetobacter senegalensis DSM 18889]
MRSVYLTSTFLVVFGAAEPALAASEQKIATHASSYTKSSSNKDLIAKAENVSVSGVHRLAMGTTEHLADHIYREAVPGTNPLKTLSLLPGIMFQSNDAQGFDTWSTQIYMHGFQQQEIGMALEDIPLGENTFRNYNGLNPLSAISAENVSRIDVSQSAGAEQVPSTNNLGGSLVYHVVEPKDKMGGTIAQTFGSNSTYRTFIRFDSGKLNASGTKFFTSYARNDTEVWKGYGNQFLQQVNAKIVQPVGNDSKISAYFDYSDLHIYNYQDYSFDMLQNAGYRLSPYNNGNASGYLAAYNAALGHYPSNLSNLSDPADAQYYDMVNNNEDYLGGITANLKLADRWRFISTAYGHSESDHSTWTSPFFSSPNGSPLSEIVRQPQIRRFGIVSSINYETSHHHASLGVWYENNHYVSPMYAYQEPLVQNGQIMGSPVNPINGFQNPFATIFNQVYNTNTFTAYMSDDYKIFSGLTVHAGFKSLLNTTRVGNGQLDQNYYGNVGNITSGVGQTSVAGFLPHFSIDYHFLHNHEIFFDFAENMHAYPQSGYKSSASPFSVLQSTYNSTIHDLKPETAFTYALGYRYTTNKILGSIYLYRTNFNNRLQQITAGSPVNPISSVSNVGNVTMDGVDAALTIRPVRGLELYNSVSYNKSTYGSNMSDEGKIYHTKGVQVVNYPEFMYKSRLSYSWKNFTTWIDGSYIGKRNFSYTGDVKAPGYWLSNLGAQYILKREHSFLKNQDFVNAIVISLNVNNLTNQKYIATMGENGNPMSVSTGALTDPSFLLGAPRQYYGTIKMEF